MPKKLKERVVRFFYSKNTKEENEYLKKELTEALKEHIIKNGFLISEILLLLLLLSVILNIIQYFLIK